MNFVKRYPVKRIEYCKTVGKTRVENIAKTLRDLGFTVIARKPEDDDVDILVFKNSELVLVVEVLNWRKRVYMDFRRVQSIIQNFSNPKYSNTRKLLVFSFKENIENQLHFFQALDVDLLEVEFQTQPIEFYHFFKNQGKACYMRPNTKKTKQIEKKKLVAYLEENNLI
jgi:Holliday junction resolvase